MSGGVVGLQSGKEVLIGGLRHRFETEIKKALGNNLGIKNIFAVPRLKSVVINMGVGEAVHDSKKIQIALNELTLIAGQKAVPTKAKKSIATFKLREGMSVGVKVTLRGNRMYEFMDRLINIALPRVRDFRGYSEKSFDGNGNYSLGIKEHIIFPEINYDKIDKIRGMDITICTTTNDDKMAAALLRSINFPLVK